MAVFLPFSDCVPLGKFCKTPFSHLVPEKLDKHHPANIPEGARLQLFEGHLIMGKLLLKLVFLNRHVNNSKSRRFRMNKGNVSRAAKPTNDQVPRQLR